MWAFSRVAIIIVVVLVVNLANCLRSSGLDSTELDSVQFSSVRLAWLASQLTWTTEAAAEAARTTMIVLMLVMMIINKTDDFQGARANAHTIGAASDML